jgi:hypothetical protein
VVGNILHTVVETPEFWRRAKSRLSAAELVELINYIAAHPDAGDVMAGTGGARKLRWAVKGKGKSGGVRVITFYSGPPIPVFLLSVFGKGEKSNLSNAERNELRKALRMLVAAYSA